MASTVFLFYDSTRERAHEVVTSAKRKVESRHRGALVYQKSFADQFYLVAAIEGLDPVPRHCKAYLLVHVTQTNGKVDGYPKWNYNTALELLDECPFEGKAKATLRLVRDIEEVWARWQMFARPIPHSALPLRFEFVRIFNGRQCELRV